MQKGKDKVKKHKVYVNFKLFLFLISGVFVKREFFLRVCDKTIQAHKKYPYQKMYFDFCNE